jgi:hypothetical protein
MAAFNKFNMLHAGRREQKHDMKTGTTDVYKVYLTNVAPVASNTVYNTPADLATANGYTATGATIGTITGAGAGGVFSFAGGTNPSWTASGGRSDRSNGRCFTTPRPALIGWWDYGTTDHAHERQHVHRHPSQSDPDDYLNGVRERLFDGDGADGCRKHHSHPGANTFAHTWNL